PQGYDTLIGERGIGLSGGQRQRIAIARVLLTTPRLLILDDSTSAVDAETEMAIQGALDRLMRDSRCTAFVIAQRISTVRDAELRPHRAVIVAAFGFIVANAVGQAAGPWLVSRAIDRDIVGHDARGLLRSILTLLAVYVVTALCQRAQTRRIGQTGQHLLAE